MNNLAEELTEALTEDGIEDADKLETVRTLIHNRRRCTPEEEKEVWRDLCRSAGTDPDAPPKQEPVATAAWPPSVDYQRIEKIVAKAVTGVSSVTTPLMNIDVVAQRFGVHPDTVKRLARRGDLEHYKVTKKVIKFDEQQVQRFLDKVRSGAVKLPTVHRFPLLTNKRSSS